MDNKVAFFRTKAGLSQEELAQRIGTTNQQIGRLESGKRKLSPDWMERLAPALGIRPHELIYHAEGDDIQPSGLPIMGEVRAGAWLEIDSDVEPVGNIPASTDQRYRSQRQYALRVVGNSMNLVARAGIYVVIADWTDNGADLKDGDLVVVRRERDHTYEVTLKRARKAGDTWEFWPESDDPKHQEPLRPSLDNLEWTVAIVGKVIGKYEPL
jgi:SOS-response transcriptional repressor LexA